MQRIIFLVYLLLFSWAAKGAQIPATCDTTFVDHHRNDRQIPVRIQVPVGTGTVPVILFSHGLGGSLESGKDWVGAWAHAGFMTVNIQHAGSDDAIWKGKRFRLLALRGVMNSTQLQARVDDVHVVLDQLAKGGRIGECDLSRADMNEVGMSGHSFGAQTTLAVAGGRYAGVSGAFDPRIKAALALSPQPSPGIDDKLAFGNITMPFFTITGTKDSFARFGGVSVQDRLRPYQAMPVGQKSFLIVDDATHMMLNGQTLARANATPTPAMVNTIDEMTILFWEATLMKNSGAEMRLLRYARTQMQGAEFHEK